VDSGALVTGLVVACCTCGLGILDAGVGAGRGVPVWLVRGGTQSGRTRGEGVSRGAGTCTGWKADKGFALGEEDVTALGGGGGSVAGRTTDGRLPDGTCAGRADDLACAALARPDCWLRDDRLAGMHSPSCGI